ncbi:protein-disulfide reductase DsbD [Conchiformibius kuhniae]|uniref:Thiol:disulfide interchange protein DsbD n=1 Tax=Conchiformibius kuhniae TaxID=211502 RepID=A0ABD8B891_9NEIS|nr:protein-disulfide reductase DsbD [Conchiformibius kuhniae]
MKNKILILLATLLGFSAFAGAAVNPNDLLPPEQAFVPTVHADENGIRAEFNIADGYYLYQSKITAETAPAELLADPEMSEGKEKEDEFFGKQTVYYHQAEGKWAYRDPAAAQNYTLTLHYQGCADVGVCYPPVETQFDIKGAGEYRVPEAAQPKDLFLKKSNGATDAAATVAPASAEQSKGSRFALSRDTLWLNLFWFFAAGLGLSFTACMYPLLPIVSGIIVGDKSGGKRRGFVLSLVYVQGLALTYTLVGVLAGLTGALLTVWLQQAWVVLAAAALMVVLALSMFGVFQIQLPAAVQSYFQNQSNKLSGGKIASVFVMGMLSALIVGPCVAPPLAFALGYIGQTGDALLGGAALYALALGTGVPLMAVGTFGGHILPRAGDWMNGIKYGFGVLLLAVAVYLATPYLPYALTAALYAALLVLPALYLAWRAKGFSGSLKAASALLAAVLAMGGLWFGWQSAARQTTRLHDFLTLYPPPAADAAHAHTFTDPAALKAAMDKALQSDPSRPVLLDFYADWCVSCKEMEAKTFRHAAVRAAVPMERLFQIDVTANTPAHQALLREYGLYGPPGLFALKADGSRSDAVLGFVPPDEFIKWYQGVAQ